MYLCANVFMCVVTMLKYDCSLLKVVMMPLTPKLAVIINIVYLASINSSQLEV